MRRIVFRVSDAIGVARIPRERCASDITVASVIDVAPDHGTITDTSRRGAGKSSLSCRRRYR
ncbi:hypothetical protein [Nocardia takedensis]|uniref:hypothetical protein n=1 Tax=Nocardia takedensis TaxID=259390 RepID=UPI0012F680F2|nr:hypothetical protein [Nocardia takedensis]